MRGHAHDGGAVRRHAVAVGLTLLLLALLAPSCLAAESGLESMISEETQRLLESMDITEIESLVPELDVASLLERAAAGENALDGLELSQALREALTAGWKQLAPGMLRIAGITVLCAGLLRLRSVTTSDGVAQMCQMLAYLCVALPISQQIAALLQQGRVVTSRMMDFYQAVLPTMLSLLTAVGGAQSAAQMQGLSLTVTSVLAGFVQKGLFAALGIAAVLACLKNFAPEIQLGRAFKLLRDGIHWSLGICFTLFLGLLTVQGTTAVNYDGLTLRAAKYAIDQFVPVVGGAFKDTTDTLIGCSIAVKNAVGVVGLVGLLVMMLKPCLGILLTMGAYRLCAAALEPLGDGRIVPALCDFADILTTLFILLISVSAMFFVFLAALMRMGMGLV